MPSPIYERMVSELSALGDLLSHGIVNSALRRVGTDPEGVSLEEAREATTRHVFDSISSIMGPANAEKVVKKIMNRISIPDR